MQADYSREGLSKITVSPRLPLDANDNDKPLCPLSRHLRGLELIYNDPKDFSLSRLLSLEQAVPAGFKVIRSPLSCFMKGFPSSCCQ